MKTMVMRFLMALMFFMLAATASHAHASDDGIVLHGRYESGSGAQIVVTEIRQCELAATLGFIEFRELKAAPSCRLMREVQNGLQLIRIGLGIGGVYAACTGAGLPVTATLGIAGVGVTTVSFVVSLLPCDDGQDEKIRKEARRAVCEILSQNGQACDPNRLPD